MIDLTEIKNVRTSEPYRREKLQEFRIKIATDGELQFSGRHDLVFRDGEGSDWPGVLPVKFDPDDHEGDE